MPQKDTSTADLPASVKDILPPHAQEIYLKAHNRALEEYRDPSKRRGQESLEEAAHKVAWDAVKNEYAKDEDTGKWVKKTGR